MEIKDIVFRNTLTQQEMEFVVEQYIKEVKGVDVKIDIEDTSKRRAQYMPDFAPMLIKGQLEMLDVAYQSAALYFCRKLK